MAGKDLSMTLCHCFPTTEKLQQLNLVREYAIHILRLYQLGTVKKHFSRKILAVVTPCGYAIPIYFMFGVKTAPANF